LSPLFVILQTPVCTPHTSPAGHLVQHTVADLYACSPVNMFSRHGLILQPSAASVFTVLVVSHAFLPLPIAPFFCTKFHRHFAFAFSGILEHVTFRRTLNLA